MVGYLPNTTAGCRCGRERRRQAVSSQQQREGAVRSGTSTAPDFFIVGHKKCGTTTLAGILEGHPDCCFSHPKEVWFFQEKALNSIDTSELNPNYAKGWEWYSKAWAHYSGEAVMNVLLCVLGSTCPGRIILAQPEGATGVRSWVASNNLGPAIILL